MIPGGGSGQRLCYGRESVCSGADSEEKARKEGGLTEMAVDALRKEMEGCDQFQGFQLYRHMGGAAGSGVGNCIREELENYWSKGTLMEVDFFPDYRFGSQEHTIAPYNVARGFNEGTTTSKLCIGLKNDDLKRARARSHFPAPSGTADRRQPIVQPDRNAKRVRAARGSGSGPGSIAVSPTRPHARSLMALTVW